MKNFGFSHWISKNRFLYRFVLTIISIIFVISLSYLSIGLTFPVKSKIQQSKHLDPFSGRALRHNSLDRRKYPLKRSFSLSFKFQK